jgi:NADH-quinone oxidoreductase subunit N
VTIQQWLIPLAPEFVLLVGAGLVLLVGLGRRSGWASPTAFLTLAVAFGLSLYVEAPRNREVLPGLWLTTLTDYTRWITYGLGLLMVLVNWYQPAAEERGEYMAMILFSLLGIALTAAANDWVVFFLALELVSVPTYVLVALSRTDARASEAAVKYFFLGALSAALLAYGLSFLYGVSGTTAIHILSGGATQSALDPTTQTGALIGLLLVFAGLFFKMAAFPFHAYAADVYEGAASPVTGLLGFVPKFAGLLGMIKVMAVFHWSPPTAVVWLLWIVAAATMTVGNVLGLVQQNVKRALAYSSIAHTGYILAALLVGPVLGQGPLRDGVAAVLFYITVYGTMNLGAFAALSAYRSESREMETLADLGGLARRAPATALALAICVFSLTGLPPTAGFLAKIYVLSSALSVPSSRAFSEPLIWLAVIVAANTAIAGAYYLRIVYAAYVAPDATALHPTGGRAVRFGLTLCTVPLLVFFVWPGGLARRTQHAASALHDVVRTRDVRITNAASPATIDAAHTHP